MAKDDLFSRISQGARNRVKNILDSTTLDERLLNTARNQAANFKYAARNFNPQTIRANIQEPQIRQRFTPKAILGRNSAELGQIAQDTLGPNQQTVKNLIDFSTRIPSGITQGLTFNTVNPTSDMPARTSYGQFGEMAGQFVGFGKSPITKAITGITNPIASKAVSRFTPRLAPFAGTLAPRVGGAVANVGQGFVFDAAQRQLPTPTSIGLDIVTGLAGGANQFDEAVTQTSKAFDPTRNKGSLWGKDEIDLVRQSREMLNNKNLTEETLGKITEQVQYLIRSHMDQATEQKLLRKYKSDKGFIKGALDELEKLAKEAVSVSKVNTNTKAYNPYEVRIPGLNKQTLTKVSNAVKDEFNIPRLKVAQEEFNIPKLGIKGNAAQPPVGDIDKPNKNRIQNFFNKDGTGYLYESAEVKANKKIYPDGTIELVHMTTPEGKTGIEKNGFNPGSYFGLHNNRAISRPGKSPNVTMKIRVDPTDIAMDRYAVNRSRLVKGSDGVWRSEKISPQPPKGTANLSQLQNSGLVSGIVGNQPAIKLNQDYSTIKNNVYNASANPETVKKILTKNQSIIEKTAKQEFDQWNKAVRQQEAPRTVAGAINDAVRSIRDNTRTFAANPEKLKDIAPISSKFRDVYRNFERVFGDNYQQVKQQILDPFDKSKGDMVREQLKLLDNVENTIINGLGIKKKSLLSGLTQLYGEGKISLDELKQRAGADYNKVVEANKFFRSEYDRLLDEVNAVRKKIYPNNPEKIIPKRKDYYRHFKEMADGIEGLKNIFETSANISSELAGVSYQTKPFAKWLSFAQKRTGDLTDVDAIGGYLDYIKAATYAKHIDPHIKVFRDLGDELAASTTPDTKYAGKVNNFITFLSRYADDLSGKTNAADRELQEALGRRTFKVINWVNNRVKANTIVGNASSMVAQIFNVPQGIANAGLRYAPTGMARTLKNLVTDRKAYDVSDFITERYQSDQFKRFDTGMLNNVRKFAEYMTGVLDEFGTKYIWDMHYQKAIAEGVKNPVKYADDVTRKMVAGRGVGEVPLGQKSKIFQLIAPFQLEVANIWHVMKDWTDNKEFDKVVKFFIIMHVFNKGAEAVRGSGVGVDPIQALQDSWEVATDDDPDKILRITGRISGEALSNLPVGQTIASAYPEYGFKVGDKQFPTREEVFGDSDPTRFGSGLLAIKGIQDPIFKLGFPYGGGQVKKFIEGARAQQKGYSETPSGKVRFPIKNDPVTALKSSLFGQYSSGNARDYFDKDRSPLGEKQSEQFKSLPRNEAQDYYDSIIRSREGIQDTADPQSIFNIDKASASDEINLPTNVNDLTTVYNMDLSTINNYEKRKTEAQYKSYKDEESRQERLDQLDADYQEAQSRVNAIKQQNPEFMKERQYLETASMDFPERQRYVARKLQEVYRPESKKGFYDFLVENQRRVNGKSIVTKPILDDLYKADLLTKYERDLFSSVSFTKDGQVKFKLQTQEAKKGKRKVFTFKPKRVNYARLKIKASQLPKISTQIQAPRLNTPARIRLKQPSIQISTR